MGLMLPDAHRDVKSPFDADFPCQRCAILRYLHPNRMKTPAHTAIFQLTGLAPHFGVGVSSAVR